MKLAKVVNEWACCESRVNRTCQWIGYVHKEKDVSKMTPGLF